MVLTDANILEYKMDLEKILTEREGMIAENHARLFHNERVAYDEKHFNMLSTKINDLHNSMIHLMGG